jgi:hypothetical protein
MEDKKTDETKVMEANMNDHLKTTADFLKETFGTDGEVTTTAKECIVIEQDGSKTFGITFVLNDSVRGKFMVTLSNPKQMKDDK